MNESDTAATGALVLLHVLTRALVANGVITKLDLSAELQRTAARHPIPEAVLSQIQALVQELPNQ